MVLRLSQSFGYSVAGGRTYGADRLGEASIAAVPVPTAAWAGFGLLGSLGTLKMIRRRLQRDAETVVTA